MYEVIFSKHAKIQLKKLDREIQRRIVRALEKLRFRPEAFLKKLIGETGFRLRVGDYKVIVDINKKKLEVLIIKIGHKKNIYS